MDFDILSHLYDNYCAEFIDLRDFIFAKFKDDAPSVYKHIIYTNNALKTEGLVIFENTDFVNIGGYIPVRNVFPAQNEFLTLEKFKERDMKIPAKITIKGKLLVEQKRFNDQLSLTNKALELSSNSSIETNRSFKTLNDEVIPGFNRRQIRLGIGTMIIAGVSTVAIMASVYVAKQGVTSEDIRSLRQQLQNNTQVLDSIRQSQKGIDSSLRKAVKDSFYRK